MGDIKRWQAEHEYDQLKDADGLAWHLDIKVTQLPDPEDSRRLLWQVRLHPQARMTARDLVAAGVLKESEDARLLAMIGDESVPLATRPTTLVAPSEAEARSRLAAELPRLKASFKNCQLAAVKRALVGRWLDERCLFGQG